MKKAYIVILITAMLFSMSACDNIAQDRSVSVPPSVTIETFGTLPTSSSDNDEPDHVITPHYNIISEETAVTTVPVEDTPVSVSVVSSDEAVVSDQIPVNELSIVLYANSSVNVREKPDADSKRMGHLDKGDMVNVTGSTENGWYRIIFKGSECYVKGSYLSEKTDATSSKETTVTTSATAKEKVTTVTSVTTKATTTVTTTTATEPSEEPQESISLEEIDVEISTQPVYSKRNYTAINYDCQKAMWFAYLDLDVMIASASKEEFTNTVREAMKNVSDMGCNTVYVHARAFGDAYYNSQLFPFAASYSGTLGVAPEYDPLEIMITEAHRLGLSFHAWVNPMRTTTKKLYAEMESSYTLKKWYNSDNTNGTYIVYDKDSGYYWLSPAYPAVRELICEGIAEIVSNYDVDGIHIDDYFYPTSDTSFDKLAFSASGQSDLYSWRREMVSTLVKDIYQTVKNCNKTVEFGISPQGNVDNNLNKLYADVETWCSSPGYLDYIVPQIYYGYNDKLPFDDTALKWLNMKTAPGIKLVCGIAAYKVGTTSEWKSGDILYRQTQLINSMQGYNGCAYYRYGTMFEGSKPSSSMSKEYDKLKQAITELN